MVPTWRLPFEAVDAFQVVDVAKFNNGSCMREDLSRI
jgi:hypothetical protein